MTPAPTTPDRKTPYPSGTPPAVRTTHEIRVGDAREADVGADSVDLVVTSPPYPMVEMWDETFAAQSPAAAEALSAGDGEAAFVTRQTLRNG